MPFRFFRRDVETPPRTWRRPLAAIAVKARCRNTSTHVEKTYRPAFPRLQEWKHLHARGEDEAAEEMRSRLAETPPRTWRRQRQHNEIAKEMRNTSTHVEKTVTARRRQRACGKHLHARGEDLMSASLWVERPETPPRTWRRPHSHRSRRSRHRNTSTHVEKTLNTKEVYSLYRKHLHARGEDDADLRMENEPVETPPRTWRRQFPSAPNRNGVRNTSTHVEKTSAPSAISRCHRKHLHARGEDALMRLTTLSASETPPRTWRRPRTCRAPFPSGRNTSTHVEKTCGFAGILCV